MLKKTLAKKPITKKATPGKTSTKKTKRVCPRIKYSRIKLFFIDTETTGLSSTDQIIQFAGIYGIWDGEKFYEEARINQYINVTIKINFFAQRVHDISNKMLSPYDYIDSYIDNFLDYIKKSHCIVGHNIGFDMRMLKQDCERIGKCCDWGKIKTFCTMKDTSHLTGLKNKKRPKLKHLYYHLFGKEFEHAHDAMADIEATKDCFVELAKGGKIKL